MAIHNQTNTHPTNIHIDNLIQLGIIRGNATKTQRVISSILLSCKDEYEMSRRLHDLWTGEYTVDKFIEKYKESAKMQKSVFTIEDYPKAYIGYFPKFKWKGWAMAHFELDEAKRVADGFNESAEHPMTYDPIYDQFYVWDEGNEDYDFVKGRDCMTEDGMKHLYPIGAGNWFWDNISDTKCFNLALKIEDFIWEFDTYHYQDECLVREEVVKAGSHHP